MTDYNRRTAFEAFQKAYPDYSHLKQNTFSLWIKRYAKINGLRVDERKSMGERYFILVDKKCPQKDENRANLPEIGQSFELNL
jgi:hypothetical protein